jgi:hypothetical protein
MEAKEELRRCLRSPYYFATRYMYIRKEDNVQIPFTTHLSEEEFNKKFFEFLTQTKKG